MLGQSCQFYIEWNRRGLLYGEDKLKAIVKSQLNTPVNKAWELVNQSQTLVYVCKGLLGFEGSKAFPKQWKTGDTINTRLKFFGFVPAWRHTLRFKKISNDSMVIFTEEKGGIVRTWNHEIKLEAKDQFSCFYTDTVEIKAGLFTPLVWVFAKVLYLYRQHRWKHLVKK